MSKQELQPQENSTQNSNSQKSDGSSEKMGDLPLRIVSAVILAIVVIGFLWLGGIGFALLMALMAVIIHWEWTNMVSAATSAMGRIIAWLFLIIVLGAVIAGEWLSSVLVLGIGFIMLLILSLVSKRQPWSPVGLVYAVAGAMAMVVLRLNEQAGIAMVLFLFAIVWLTDIGAYACGRMIGGPKFAPRVSPKKTWAGFIGGVSIGTICGSLFIYYMFGSISIIGIAITLFLSVFSQYGDLFESWIKRRFGVKDSSQLIPGHGGVMDRVDGLSPTAALFVLFAMMSLYFAPKSSESAWSVETIAQAALELLI